MPRLQALILGLAALALVPGCGKDDATTPGSGGGGSPGAKPTLVFSAIPSTTDQTGYEARFGKVAEWLSERLGVTVKYQHSADYAQSVAAFVSGDVLFAWFGGLTGVQARHRVEGAHAIAQGIEDPKYYSYFIAHKDTGLERSDEFPKGIEGKTFTFGSRDSTSGRLMPEHFIRTLGGKAPDEYFASVAFSGGHNTTALQVNEGVVEVGAISYKTYDKMAASGEIDPDVARIIWKTPVYADYNITAHPDLDKVYGAGFTTKLQKALVDMPTELVKPAFERETLIEAKDADFAAIAELAAQLGFLDN